MTDEERIAALEQTWHATIELGRGFDDTDWSKPTGCPGWSVKDVMAHLVGFERAIAGHPEPDVTLPDDLPHVRNESGRYMETHVEARRSTPGREVLREFESFAADRIRDLRTAVAAVGGDSRGGTHSLGDLQTRVLDSFIHEQDIRRATEAPGGFDSSAAALVLDVLIGSIGYALAKKARIAEGVPVTFVIDGDALTYERRNGRVDRLDDVPDPAAVLTMDRAVFVAIMAGRSDAGMPQIDGDHELGRSIIENLAVTP